MTDSQESVASPCIGVCALDADDVCIGCYRSSMEIGGWSAMSAQQKRAVLLLAEQRYREQWTRSG
jgi:uncharacterized protein